MTGNELVELSPTVDHVVPIAVGGADDESNCITTSMCNNMRKGNQSAFAMGWELAPPGDLADWDGLTGWFRGYFEAHREELSAGSGAGYLEKWYSLLGKVGG